MCDTHKSERVKRSREMRPSAALAAVVLMLAVGTLNAQQHSVALRGLVFNSTTGQALSDVAIHLDQNLAPVVTDSLGKFLLFGLSTGSHSLTVAKEGYGPHVYSFSVTEEHGDTVDLGSFPLAHADALTATISGTVLDARTGSPVTVSGVYVNGDLANVSADGGEFTTGRIEVTPGVNMLEFRRIGYEPFQARMWAVQPHTELELAVHLLPAAVRVPTVLVEGSYLREFHQRSRWGLGDFLTQRDVEEAKPLLISEMLRSIPGVRVRPGRFGNRVTASQAFSFGGGGCISMSLYIDGTHIIAAAEDTIIAHPAEALDALVQPDNVAAIEVYARPSQVPVQFRTREASCGVIVVWTKR